MLDTHTLTGRMISQQELEDIKETVSLCSGLSLHELLQTICDHLEWVTPSGTNKVDACYKLLVKLENQGVLKLPEKEARAGYRKRIPRTLPETDAGPALEKALKELGPIKLSMVTDARQRELWNGFIRRYHYLSYKKPIGYTVRYFIECSDGTKLGCLLLSGASKSLKMRDEWIGWNKTQRLNKLPWVVNQSRFLIFPWVRVPYLASHVLGKLAKRVAADYQQCWGFEPVLMETFVDETRFCGTCYRAAGWHLLGRTRGRGLARPGKTYTSQPKLMFVKQLRKDFRQRLCSHGQ